MNPSSGSGRAATPEKPGFRPDIDALRALAILLVVGYHAHLDEVPGGFVGVDVFFVISGFLITRNLLDERARTGRIGLGAFWARRLRRLVPAMSVMVLVTCIAGAAILTPLEWGDLWRRGLAATTYVSNVVFARQRDGYFAADVDLSPFLHTWSLSVEEQFYVVWPVAVAGLLALRRLGRRRPIEPGSRPGAGLVPVTIGLLALSAASLAWSARLVDAGDPFGYYGLPSRAWEFALAGLLAVAATRFRGRLPAAAAAVTGLAGLALIWWSATRFDEATPFPGVHALVPVAGTLAVIAAGTWSEVTWRLAVRPARWLGRLSYSWYLWHWPVMVLLVAQLDRDTPGIRLVGAGGALLVAMASLRFVEDPVRRDPRLTRSTRTTVAVALAFSVVAALGAVGVRQWGERPFPRELAAAASKDYLAGCTWSDTDDGDPVCTVGDPDGDATIVLAGDSHAMSWVPGFDEAGRELGLKVLVRAKSNCPGAPVPTISTYSMRVNTGCLEYRAATRRLIDDTGPALVVLASADFTRRVADADGDHVSGRTAQLQAWGDALRTFRVDLAAEGTDLGIVLDNPRITPDPLLCTGEAGSPAGCGATRDDALHKVARHIANERSVVAPGAAFDTVDLACDADGCPAYRDGTYVYSDATHLSRSFTAKHAPQLAAWLRTFPAVPHSPRE